MMPVIRLASLDSVERRVERQAERSVEPFLLRAPDAGRDVQVPILIKRFVATPDRCGLAANQRICIRVPQLELDARWSVAMAVAWLTYWRS